MKLILENLDVFVPLFITWILSIIVFTNQKLLDWLRKPFVTKKEKVSLETDELNLNEKSLKVMEQYLEFQDERFVKLLDENKKLLKEIEESKAKCKAEMDSYKRYMKRVHTYVLGLQKLLENNNITFEKCDENGTF